MRDYYPPTATVAIDITDPRLGVEGGGRLNPEIAAVLGRGDRHREAQYLWEVYRALCRARAEGNAQAKAPSAEAFVALVGSGATVAAVRAFIDERL